MVPIFICPTMHELQQLAQPSLPKHATTKQPGLTSKLLSAAPQAFAAEICTHCCTARCFSNKVASSLQLIRPLHSRWLAKPRLLTAGCAHSNPSTSAASPTQSDGAVSAGASLHIGLSDAGATQQGVAHADGLAVITQNEEQQDVDCRQHSKAGKSDPGAGALSVALRTQIPIKPGTSHRIGTGTSHRSGSDNQHTFKSTEVLTRLLLL